MTSTFLGPASKRFLYIAYCEILDRICEKCGIDRRYVSVSELGISNAFAEVNGDIDALKRRRPFKHGVSAGKIAGALAFRLFKTQVLFFGPEIADRPEVQKLALNTAVALAFELVGTNYEAWPSQLVRELKYFLERRHSNQESLGLFFDTIATSIPKTGAGA